MKLHHPFKATAVVALLLAAGYSNAYTLRVPVKGLVATASQGSSNSLTLAPSSLSFGNVSLGSTSAIQTVTLTNPGSTSVSVGPISASTDFGESNNCPSTLGAGASCSISTTFTPTKGTLETGSLSITTGSGNQSVTLSGTGSDPYFSNVTLLMHMSDFTDSSGHNTLSTVGAPAESTTTYQFGPGALSLNGSSALKESYSSNFDFGTGDFTIEFWLNTPIAWTSQTSGASIMGQKASDTTNGWVIYRDSTQGSKLNLRITTTLNFCTSASTPAQNVWEHWAVVRHGTTLTWYHNGTQDSTCTIGASASVSDPTATFYMGYSQTWGGYLHAYLDDVRVTKGVARYTSNFTVPTSAFPNQ